MPNELDLSLTESAEMLQQALRSIPGQDPALVNEFSNKIATVNELHEDPHLSKNIERLSQYHELCEELYDKFICKDMDVNSISSLKKGIHERSKNALGMNDELDLEEDKGMGMGY